MIHDRVRFIEAFRGNDMLVSNPLILKSRPLTIATKPDVMLPRDFSQSLVIRHSRILLVLCCHSDPAGAGEESLAQSEMFRFAQHDKIINCLLQPVRARWLRRAL